jgi:hypothetical protein
MTPDSMTLRRLHRQLEPLPIRRDLLDVLASVAGGATKAATAGDLAELARQAAQHPLPGWAADALKALAPGILDLAVSDRLIPPALKVLPEGGAS